MGVWLFCAFLTYNLAELFKMFSFNCENYSTSDMPKRLVLDPSPKCQDQDHGPVLNRSSPVQSLVFHRSCQNRFLRQTPTRAEISTKGCRQQAEEMWRCRGLWLQRMCCALAIPASSYFRGLKDRVTEVRRRSELPEGRGDRGDRGEFAGSIQDDI